MNKKASAFFQSNVSGFVESIGGVTKDCDYAKEYTLETSIGQMVITIFDSWISCSFADNFAAFVFSRNNGPKTGLFAGKWMFLYHAKSLANGLIIGDFVEAVERLMAYVPTPEEKEQTEFYRSRFTREVNKCVLA